MVFVIHSGASTMISWNISKQMQSK